MNNNAAAPAATATVTDWNGTEYAIADLPRKMATTANGQTVDIVRVDTDGEATIRYPNGRRGFEPISDLSVLRIG